MSKLTVVAFAILLVACVKSKPAEIIAEVEEEIAPPSRIQRIKIWRDSTRLLELPFRANFDTTTVGTFRVKFWEADSLFRNDFRSDAYVMGLLADTANFFAFAYIEIASVGNVRLITFDKSGRKIDNERLTRDNCVIYVGEILLCKEYTIVETDLSLNYYFKSVVFGEGDSMDTVCTNVISKGRVNRTGEIDTGKPIQIDCSR
jgi:hypothetical protein